MTQYQSVPEVPFSDDRAYAEVAALFEICGLIPDYPRDFRKGEHPDWINDEICLEVSKAMPDEEFAMADALYCKVGDLNGFAQGSLKYDIRLQCRMTSGVYKGEDFELDPRKRLIISDSTELPPFEVPEGSKAEPIPVKSSLYYDTLPEKDKADVDSAKVMMTTRSDIDNPYYPTDLVLECFEEKLGKLQSYKVRRENHLFIHTLSIFFIDDIDTILSKFAVLTREWKDAGKRVFDTVFLSAVDGMHILHPMEKGSDFIPIKRRVFELYRENIHDPPVPEGYLFEDVVREVPDLRLPEAPTTPHH